MTRSVRNGRISAEPNRSVTDVNNVSITLLESQECDVMREKECIDDLI